MNDILLTARLDALEQDLLHAKDPRRWKDKFNLKNVFESEKLLQYFGDYLWKYFDDDINKGVNDCLQRIGSIRENLEGTPPEAGLEEAWRDYHDVYEDSQKVFHECLELLGGLALREQQIDERICQVADEIIFSCSATARLEPTVTVPAPREALAKTLGRIVRLRFPVWTIWTLPFIAHEYGHVVVEEKPGFKSFADDIVAEWSGKATQVSGGASIDPGKEPFRRRCAYQVYELMADAFATYTMGPAYAFAGVLLWFNPSSAGSKGDRCQCDAQRAYVVLSTLRMLDSMTQQHPYKAIIEYLESCWNESLRIDKEPASLGEEDKKRLDSMIEGLERKEVKRSDPFLTADARYPHGSGEEGGWGIAQGWADRWLQELKAEPRDLSIPEGITRNSRLRDALNAAWLCRFYSLSNDNLPSRESTQRIQLIAAAALSLCQKISQENNRPPDRQRNPHRRL